ncbi:hypothetical protein I3842_03G017300 [Carya illinoinensis]|uniref:Uncharacterized protein n=1 Tax=Carya illinoinensis TaxID=32201 RepID=A0A922FGD7_CARIL|nr:hypothetical protein I3842_03G017300 [Carya illinoinensis]
MFRDWVRLDGLNFRVFEFFLIILIFICFISSLVFVVPCWYAPFCSYFFCFLRNMTLKGTSHILLVPKVSVLLLHFSSSIFMFCLLLFLCPFLFNAFIFFHVGCVQSG